MKNVYTKTFLLAPLFVLNACHSDKGQSIESSDRTDTMRVTGTYIVSPELYKSSKVIKCITRDNTIKDYSFSLSKDPTNNFAYVERGDTIIMQGHEFIKNLTQERLQNEFVKCR